MQEQGGELDMFDTVTAYLIDEGLVRDFDHAQKVMTTLDSSLIEEVHAEQLQLLEGYGEEYNKSKPAGRATPESGTGKYYKEGQPTAKQLEVRAQQAKNREAANRGRMPNNITDAYLQVYEKFDSSYSHAYATTKEKAPKMQKGAKTKKSK